ncbi:MAG: hypothetical protein IAE64_01145 [Flavobacteriales bacterium]|nr:hypothetical protein [Flavobacteriales bacterium]
MSDWTIWKLFSVTGKIIGGVVTGVITLIIAYCIIPAINQFLLIMSWFEEYILELFNSLESMPWILGSAIGLILCILIFWTFFVSMRSFILFYSNLMIFIGELSAEMGRSFLSLMDDLQGTRRNPH